MPLNGPSELYSTVKMDDSVSVKVVKFSKLTKNVIFALFQFLDFYFHIIIKKFVRMTPVCGTFI